MLHFGVDSRKLKPCVFAQILLKSFAALIDFKYNSVTDIQRVFRVRQNVPVSEYSNVYRQIQASLEFNIDRRYKPLEFEVQIAEGGEGSQDRPSGLPFQIIHEPECNTANDMGNGSNELFRTPIVPDRVDRTAVRSAASGTGTNSATTRSSDSGTDPGELGSSVSDSGNAGSESSSSGSGSSSSDSSSSSSSSDSSSSGSGSGSCEQGQKAAAPSSGNAGDDGSGSGDENNRKPDPRKTVNDGEDDSIITIEDSEDENKELPAGSQPSVETETEGQKQTSDGKKNAMDLTKRKKGKQTANLPIKNRSQSDNVDPSGEQAEVNSSDASEPELMSSLQLQRTTDHCYVREPRPELGYSEMERTPEYQTDDDDAMDLGQEQSTHWHIVSPNDGVPATGSPTPDEGASERTPPPVPRRIQARRRPSRPRPYPAYESRGPRSVLRAETFAERLLRICDRDRVTNLNDYDQAQGPSGVCKGSEDSSQRYIDPTRDSDPHDPPSTRSGDSLRTPEVPDPDENTDAIDLRKRND